MKLLSNEIHKNGYTYLQCFRGEKSAMYRQVDKEDPSKVYAYEVFKLKINKGGERFGQVFDDSEAFPNDEAFGKWAWTYSTLTNAIEKFRELEGVV